METLNKDKLVISDFYNGQMLGFRLEDNKAFRIYDFGDDCVLGNIYCGHVKDIAKNINAAFVEFDNNKKGYLSLGEVKETVRSGDRILVQVAGDQIKSKNYRLTTKIDLTSEAVVLTVGNTDISISKKNSDKHKREELKELLMPYKNSEYGFIIRTKATELQEAEILEQAEDLIKKWDEIKHKFNFVTLKSALLRNDNLIKTCLEYKEKFNGIIITDRIDICDRLHNAGIECMFNDDSKVSLSNKYFLDKHLREALSRRVWLKSGAYIVIEPSEALTVIDVNTGKAELRTNREETFKKINNEAALEIARQLQLRNISGIIVVDFINMKEQELYDALQQSMEQYVKSDFNQCHIVGFTKLGLMEISRKKKEKPVYEIISVPQKNDDEEISELGKRINDMADVVEKLNEENTKKQLLVKNAEIKSLQNQINAHFMFNVLETIKMMAEIKEDYEISDAITSLGEMFRYSVKWSSGMVEIKEEIKYIQNYLELLNLRLDFEIFLSLNIPKKFQHVKIPKMSLQPLIENAVYHGIENMGEDAYIYVKVFEEDDIINIEVSDPGAGIDNDRLIDINEKLNSVEEIDEQADHGRALYNVQQRIKMYFGQEYGLRLYSEEGMYTKVLIKIPKDKEI